jgi:lipid A 3-O-deacylase
MINQPKAIVPIVLFFFFISMGNAQQTEEIKRKPTYFKKQIELLHDNDFLLFTDWYYTTGSFVHYRILLNELEEVRHKRQLEFSLSQEYYTPSNLESENIEDFDRPYAGYSALTSKLTFTNRKHILDFTFQMGVSGAISGAEGFQSWFHSTNESKVPSWIGQIDDAVHANFYANYTQEWPLLPNPFSVYMAWRSGLAMGTKDFYIQNEGRFYFGKRNGLMNTMAYRQLGEIKPEFFFVVTFAHRYVMHDGLLEGAILGDNSEFILNPINNLFIYGIEGFYRKRRMEFKLGYKYSSPKAATTDVHSWITLSVARNF